MKKAVYVFSGGVIILAALVAAVPVRAFEADDDLSYIKTCFNQNVETTRECAAADLNGDGVVNFLDAGLLKNAIQTYDLNGDGIVDEDGDLPLLKACFYTDVSSGGKCVNADLNGDGIVNFLDVGVLRSAIERYDLNDSGAIEGEPPSITYFSASLADDDSVTLSWSASVVTEAALDFRCPDGSIEFLVKDEGKVVGCEKGGVMYYDSARADEVVLLPRSNTTSVDVDFSITLIEDGSFSGDREVRTLTIPAQKKVGGCTAAVLAGASSGGVQAMLIVVLRIAALLVGYMIGRKRMSRERRA